MYGTMTKREVAKFFNISISTVERNCKKGFLPPPIYLGPRSPRWLKSEIFALLHKTKV